MAPLNVVFGAVINPSNGANNGSIGRTIVTGGVTPYNFLWSSPTFEGNGLAKHDLAANVYTLTVTDALGASFEFTFTLVMNTIALKLLPGSVTASSDFKDTGSITQSYIYGGIAPYLMHWSYEPINDDLMPQVDMPPGSHVLTITDSAGTVVQHTFVIPTVYSPLALQPGAVTAVTPTRGGIIESSVITGGKLPYVIEWNFDTSADVAKKENLNVGTYTVTVRSADNQSVIRQFIVPEAITIRFGAINANKNAIAATTVLGGVAPLTYVWARKNHIESQFTTPDARPIKRDVYTIVVTDSSGQTVVNTFKNL